MVNTQTCILRLNGVKKNLLTKSLIKRKKRKKLKFFSRYVICHRML
jgi:hypothetical protein